MDKLGFSGRKHSEKTKQLIRLHSNPPNKRRDIIPENIEYLYHTLKWSLNEIADHFKCSHSTISKYVKNKRTISEGTKLAIAKIDFNGENNPMYGKTPPWKMVRYKKIWFRSQWEVIYAKLFDKLNLKWEYEKKRFTISNGTTYSPDFYLPNQNVYIEVKGYERDSFKEKFFLLKKEYPEVNIYMTKGISKFHQMWTMQYIFGNQFTKFGKLNQVEKQNETKTYFICLISELEEMLKEINFKHWKKEKPIRYKKLLGEISDAFHFVIAICLIWDIDPDTLYKIYEIKNKENHKRQKNGY